MGLEITPAGAHKASMGGHPCRSAGGHPCRSAQSQYGRSPLPERWRSPLPERTKPAWEGRAGRDPATLAVKDRALQYYTQCLHDPRPWCVPAPPAEYIPRSVRPWTAEGGRPLVTLPFDGTSEYRDHYYRRNLPPRQARPPEQLLPSNHVATITTYGADYVPKPFDVPCKGGPRRRVQGGGWWRACVVAARVLPGIRECATGSRGHVLSP